MKTSTTKIPRHLLVIANLAAGINIIFSLGHIVLSVLALLYRSTCVTDEALSGSSYFIDVIHRVYFQKAECEHVISAGDVTSADSVRILVLTTLAVSIVSLIAAVALVSILAEEGEGRSQYVIVIAFTFIGVYLVTLIVDITFATFFGMDYTYLKDLLDESTPGSSANYLLDMLRLGSLLLMTIALKGFVVHAVSIVLVILLAVYAVEHSSELKKIQHSIHAMGALNAFEEQKRNEDSWQMQQRTLEMPFRRGPQTNQAFVNDEDPRHNPVREVNYNSRGYERSDSWYHNQPQPSSSGIRPFSYLDEMKQAQPRVPPPPAEPWRRDPWLPPPSAPSTDPWVQRPVVPAPDYSPQPARRLKSALKPVVYM